MDKSFSLPYRHQQVALRNGSKSCFCFIVQDLRPVHVQTSWRLVNRGMGHVTRVSTSILTAEDMETIDFGNYICKTKNQHGETIVAINIVSK